MSEQKRSHEDSDHQHCNDNKKSKKHNTDTFPANYMRIEPYLYFDGNCAEAIEFYLKVFNGEKTFVTLYKDAPFPVAEEYKDKVMHASITFHDGDASNRNTIMFSDIMPDKCGEHKVGSSVHLSIGMTNFESLNGIFNRFVEHKDTKVGMPLAKQFWGSIYGNLVDPYGVNWMFSCPEEKKETDKSSEAPAEGK